VTGVQTCALPILSVERGHRKAEGQAERELPVGNGGAQPSSDAGVEPDVLRRPRLPDGAEQDGVSLVFAPGLLSVDLGHHADPARDGQLADEPPDTHQVARRALDAETSVEVKHEWPERVADDADPFEAEAPLSLLGGGQQGPGLHRNPESLLSWRAPSLRTPLTKR